MMEGQQARGHGHGRGQAHTDNLAMHLSNTKIYGRFSRSFMKSSRRCRNRKTSAGTESNAFKR
jgi:hypothetical protein